MNHQSLILKKSKNFIKNGHSQNRNVEFNPNYFKQYRNDLIRNLTIKNEYLDLNNPLIRDLKSSNSVSIHIRRNKFSDQKGINNSILTKKSLDFTNDIISYIMEWYIILLILNSEKNIIVHTGLAHSSKLIMLSICVL